MDTEKLVEEVVRRLIDKLRTEQTGETIDSVSGATSISECHKETRSKKQLITESEAMKIARHSKVVFSKGTVITPLAKDVLKQRDITIEFE